MLRCRFRYFNMEASLRAIAAKASTIHERLGADFVPATDESQDHLVAARMQAWVKAAAHSDWAAFANRLEWDGLDPVAVRRILGSVCLRPHAALPPWTATLSDVLQLAQQPRERERCLDEQHPIPFEDVLAPFVTWARAKCASKSGDAYASFTPRAHASLERHLLRRLSAQAARSLLNAMSLEMPDDDLSLDFFLCSPSRAVYDAFVNRMLSGGLLSFFEEYSVLARVLATCAEMWVEAVAEMIARVHEDACAIGSMAGVQGDIEVTAVAPALSDLHNGQRSVAILTIGPNKRIVYKPRTVTIESAWNALLAWLAESGAPLAPRPFRVIDRGEYGWAEFLENAACKNDHEVSRYFERAGGLLCLVLLLQGTDCHSENIISAGEHPILIDLETMLTPEVQESPVGAESTQRARNLLSRSVLSSHLLPVWTRRISDGEVFDGSGFGAPRQHEFELPYRRWINVNTDSMRVVREAFRSAPDPATATNESGSLRVYEHEAEVVRGFEAMYRFLMRERGALLAPGGPLERLGDAQVRFVYRNTAVYLAVLDRLTHPDLLRDGVDRSIEIESLAAPALSNKAVDGRPGWVNIWNAERQAIDRGDVPHFVALARESSLYAGANMIASDWFERSGHAVVMDRLNLFAETDLAFQIDFIQSTLRSRTPAQPIAFTDNGASINLFAPASAEERSELWISEAVRIAELLARAAIRGADGSASWLQPAWSQERMRENSHREVDVVGHDLYDGAGGIGLFLAAVYRVTGDRDLRSLAVAAVQPLVLDLERDGDDFAAHHGIGGLTGLGSVIYALAQMSSLLDEPELLHAAEHAARLITAERIDADDALDVTLGSAGALLGLLSLYEKNRSSAVLSGAIHCGNRLISKLEPAGNGVRSVRTLDGRFLNGFSHGAAGIAYSLCRLSGVASDESFLKAPREIIEFERNSFSAEHGDWPDLRHAGSTRFVRSWCHGAPGIGLARAASLGIMDDPTVRFEIDLALAKTSEHQDNDADFLCCGACGIVDVLATSAAMLDRADLRERANTLAWKIVSRSGIKGEYALGVPSAGQLRSPGLFQGLAGIGYTLLRLARPDLTPQLLLLR